MPSSDRNYAIPKALPASSDLIAAMAKIAKKKRENLSALVHRVLQPYVEVGYAIETVSYGLVTLPRTTVDVLFKHVPDREFENEGFQVGRKAPPMFLRPFGRSAVQFTDLRFYLEHLKDKHFKVYRVSFQDKGNGYWRLTLKHELGRKWSIFTKGYIKGLFQDCAVVDGEPELTSLRVVFHLHELHGDRVVTSKRQ